MQNIMYIEQARAVGDKTITSHNQLYVCMCMYLLWTLRCIYVHLYTVEAIPITRPIAHTFQFFFS